MPGEGVDAYPNAGPSSMSLGPDGNVFMTGSFLRFQGRDSAQFVRLDPVGQHVPTLSTFLGCTNGTGNVVFGGHANTPEGKIIVFGQFTHVQGSVRHRIARLNSDGSLDPSFDPGTQFQSTSIWDAGVQPDGKVVVLIATTARIARLNSDGSVDPTFSSTIHSQLSGRVGLHVQADGKLLVYGGFSNWSTSGTRGLVRLLANGAVDATFTPGTGVNTNAWIEDLAIDGSGRIIIVGNFTSFGGGSRNCKARLSPNGPVDATFDAQGATHSTLETVMVSGTSLWVGGAISKTGPYTMLPGIWRLTEGGLPDAAFQPGAGFIGGGVTDLVVQSDGTCLVAGAFRAYGSQYCTGLVRINADGTMNDHIDRGHGSGFDGHVEEIVVQPDGKILVVGGFYHFFGQWTPGICRLTPNGGSDPTFSTDFQGGHTILDVDLQPDGRILVAGTFPSFGPVDQRCLIRLNADGSHDATFNAQIDPLSTATQVVAVEPLPDGRMYIGGNFTSIGGVARNRIARLNADGSLDGSFTSAVSLTPQCFAVQPDGKLLVGNMFGPGVLERLNSDGSNDATFGNVTTASSFDEVHDVVVQPDGKVIVCGYFSTINGVTRSGSARLEPNGTVDASFVPSGYAPFESKDLLLLPDGRIHVAGSSTTSTYKGFLVRLLDNGAIDTGFSCDAGSVNVIKLTSDGALLTGGILRRMNGYNRHFLARLNAATAQGVLLGAKCLLQGPYVQADQLMRDDLRAGDLLPSHQPYTALGFGHPNGDAETVSSSLFNITGNNAVVDWVLLELRDAAAPSTISASRCALLQRDGDVVELDGISPLYFPVAPGSYHVAVRHRNHLGAMSADPIALGSSPSFLDLSLSTTPTYGNGAMSNIGGAMALWAGDVSKDGLVKYTGTLNDRDQILTAVGGTTPNNTIHGYLPGDVNLDGVVKYTGQSNDRDPLLVNIGSTTPNNVRSQQLP